METRNNLQNNIVPFPFLKSRNWAVSSLDKLSLVHRGSIFVQTVETRQVFDSADDDDD